MVNQPLMPKATAVWLVDNTALTFDQIADFCGLHPLEISAIADGEAAQGIMGLDPISNGQISRDDITEGEGNPKHKLKLLTSSVRIPEKKRKTPRYTPLSKRQDRPNAILWLVRNHPELKDSQISKLVGTTKGTIEQIRERTHWNSANLQPLDPVTLGLCTQIDLDFAVSKAAKDRPVVDETAGDSLLPASETEILEVAATPEQIAAEEELDADAVFAKLNALKGDSDDNADDGQEGGF